MGEVGGMEGARSFRGKNPDPGLKKLGAGKGQRGSIPWFQETTGGGHRPVGWRDGGVSQVRRSGIVLSVEYVVVTGQRGGGGQDKRKVFESTGWGCCYS